MDTGYARLEFRNSPLSRAQLIFFRSGELSVGSFLEQRPVIPPTRVPSVILCQSVSFGFFKPPTSRTYIFRFPFRDSGIIIDFTAETV